MPARSLIQKVSRGVISKIDFPLNSSETFARPSTLICCGNIGSAGTRPPKLQLVW
jgi:hypothetical protein